MKLPFNSTRDFFDWFGAIVIMIPVVIILVIATFILYLFVPFPGEDEGWNNNYEDEK